MIFHPGILFETITPIIFRDSSKLKNKKKNRRNVRIGLKQRARDDQRSDNVSEPDFSIIKYFSLSNVSPGYLNRYFLLISGFRSFNARVRLG